MIDRLRRPCAFHDSGLCSLQAVIFDYDGVLADTERLHLRAMQETLSPMGVALPEADYFERYLGLDDEGVFRAVSDAHRLRWTDELLATLVADKAERFQRTLATIVEQIARQKPRATSESRRATPESPRATPDVPRATPDAPRATPEPPRATATILFPGAASCLAACSRHVPVAIASGSLREEIEMVLDAEGLRELVPVIVAAGETERGKPYPDPYLRALALLQAARDPRLEPLEAGRCVVIEDSPWGIDAARAAGMKVAAVATSYRPDRLSADLVVDRLQDLDLEALEKLVGAPPAPRQ